LDKITKEAEGTGVVLGGAPVKVGRIATDLRKGEHSVRRNLDRLQGAGYIERTRTPYGFTIKVRNSHKFHIWSRKEKAKNGRPLLGESGQEWPACPSNLADLTVNSGRNKEDAAVDTAIDAAANRQPSVWNEIAVHPRTLPPEFREICQGLHATRNGQPILEFMSLCMDLWESRGNKIPAPFAKAAAEIREREKSRKTTSTEMPELEELAWRKK
jgi:hypothetical protein